MFIPPIIYFSFKSPSYLAGTYIKFFINVFLCSGQGPFSFIAVICAAVPYPLCFANPYSGYTSSYSLIILSLVTFATIDAADMLYIFASPFIIDVYGIPFVSICSNASTKILSGFIFKFPNACVRAFLVAFSMFISSISFSVTIPCTPCQGFFSYLFI